MNRSTRRDFLRSAAAATAAAALPQTTFAKQKAKQPNIVLIMGDDMGYSDIGCYGSEIRTPTLDALADGGVRFTHFYNTARCCPTRASLLSGLYPHQAGMGHMTSDDKLKGYTGGLNQTCVTIAEVMKTAGYSTYMTGKWHVTRHIAPEGPKNNWPRQRGFDRFYGIVTGAASFWDPFTLTRDNTMITPENDPEYKPTEKYHFTAAIGDNAVKYIREHDDKNPFFIYMPFTAAHWPMHAREKTIDRYKGRYDKGWDALRAERHKRMIELGVVEKEWKITPPDNKGWENEKDKAWQTRRMEVYAAMVDEMDQAIANVVAEIKRRDMFDNTLILFLQDNGGCAEENGSGKYKAADPATLKPMDKDELQRQMTPTQTRDGRPVRQGVGVMPGPDDTYVAYGRQWANASNTPFRLYKHWVHEGGISTPLIAHWPVGIAARGELRHQPGHLIDIMATCVDIAGADYPKRYKDNDITPLEGKSLAPAFADKPIERQAIYWEHEGNRAIRQGKWKLVAKGATGPWELYDMQADRTETNDLSVKMPERARELERQWNDYAKRTNVLPWPWKKK